VAQHDSKKTIEFILVFFSLFVLPLEVEDIRSPSFYIYTRK